MKNSIVCYSTQKFGSCQGEHVSAVFIAFSIAFCNFSNRKTLGYVRICRSAKETAYMSDLHSRINEMNLQIQGDELNLVKSKSVIVAFIKELVLFKQNLGHGHLYQFPNLNRLRDNGEVNDDDMLLYCNHMTMLHTDMCERYADILSMTLPTWILDPFSSVDGADVFLQEELIELQANDELKPKLKNIGLASFGCSLCGCVSAAVVRTCSNCSLLGAVLLGLTDVVLSLFAELINDSWYCEFNGPISLGDAAGDASEVTADNDSSDCNLSIELGESDSASTSSEAGASSDDAIVCNGTVLANESEMDIVESESREADLATF
uniref:Uncharacterized protein n=1 Tax=Trichuris muris TaxID=70415 RepID=A0A5S6Q2G6_TRIMR